MREAFGFDKRDPDWHRYNNGVRSIEWYFRPKGYLIFAIDDGQHGAAQCLGPAGPRTKLRTAACIPVSYDAKRFCETWKLWTSCGASAAFEPAGLWRRCSRYF